MKRISAFKYALNGMLCFFKETVHAKIHALFALIVVLFGIYYQLQTLEWVAIVFCIAFVLSLEALNSAIEFLVDLVSPDYHELAKKAKDVAAAAVLMAALFSVLIASLIFIPKF